MRNAKRRKKTDEEGKTVTLWTKVAVQDGEHSYKRSIEIRGVAECKHLARVSSTMRKSGTRDCYLSFATLSCLLCLTCETLPWGAFITMNTAQGPHNGLLTRDATSLGNAVGQTTSYLSVLAKLP